MQHHLFEQFSSESHCSLLKDFIITFIDKNDTEDPKRCKIRSPYQRMPPLGLNVVEDQVIFSLFNENSYIHIVLHLSFLFMHLTCRSIFVLLV